MTLEQLAKDYLPRAVNEGFARAQTDYAPLFTYLAPSVLIPELDGARNKNKVQHFISASCYLSDLLLGNVPTITAEGKTQTLSTLEEFPEVFRIKSTAELFTNPKVGYIYKRIRSGEKPLIDYKNLLTLLLQFPAIVHKYGADAMTYESVIAVKKVWKRTYTKKRPVLERRAIPLSI